jgi:hypothetical protein
MVIPIDRFQQRSTFGEIASELNIALDGTGYFEKSFYSVPGGFAVVTRLEHIYPDGLSFKGNARWVVGDPEILSLTDYFRRLFRVGKGYYRVVLFVVTSVPFGSTQATVTSDNVGQWLGHGDNHLADDIAKKSVPPSTQCTAVIYEFVKQDGVPPNIDIPSLLSAEKHLQASGILAALLPDVKGSSK